MSCGISALSCSPYLFRGHLTYEFDTRFIIVVVHTTTGPSSRPTPQEYKLVQKKDYKIHNQRDALARERRDRYPDFEPKITNALPASTALPVSASEGENAARRRQSKKESMRASYRPSDTRLRYQFMEGYGCAEARNCLVRRAGPADNVFVPKGRQRSAKREGGSRTRHHTPRRHVAHWGRWFVSYSSSLRLLLVSRLEL